MLGLASERAARVARDNWVERGPFQGEAATFPCTQARQDAEPIVKE